MRLLLLPFGLIYGLITSIRNFFYNKGWLRSFEFDFPIILVGNLSAGGTGKTPHVEYLIKALQDHYKVATLSRGYKRTMKGYGLATDLSLVEDIGDEPKLYKHKYPKTEVAVSENRVTGVYYLLNDEPETRVILMDDGFQHRRIKAGFNIILTTWQQPYFSDYMLPAGNLRESASGKKRGQVVIVTKCPADLTNDQRLRFKSQLNLENNQPVFFTQLAYGILYPLFIDQPVIQVQPADEVILLTGIAANKQLKQWVGERYKKVHVASFADHHYYTQNDLARLLTSFPTAKSIITTEKDAMRLMEQKDAIIKAGFSIFVLPVDVRFLGDEEAFLNLIHDYIEKYPPNAAKAAVE